MEIHENFPEDDGGLENHNNTLHTNESNISKSSLYSQFITQLYALLNGKIDSTRY